jgi:hypothetical protein
MRPRLESRSCCFSIGSEFRTPSSGNRTHERRSRQAEPRQLAIHTEPRAILQISRHASRFHCGASGVQFA